MKGENMTGSAPRTGKNLHGSFEYWHPHGNGTGLVTCTHCGSLTTTAFLAAVASGVKPELADFKYGYPHKFYLDTPCKPHMRQISSKDLEVKRDAAGQVTEVVKQITEKRCTSTHAKFYTIHLLDASPEEVEAFNVYAAQAHGFIAIFK